jgi:UDP-N-acetylmuramyl-tripeptide synthetases
MKKINYYWQKLKNIFHLINALLANIWYGFPSRKIIVIGITGTDGKTTTTELIAHILKVNKKKASYISTVSARIANKEYDTGFHVTTPDPWLIQKLIKEAVDKKQEYFILETTSHALDQNRVWGIKYYIGLLTNVTNEHLDYHQTYEEYVKTKERLLKTAKIGVLNVFDKSYSLLSQKTKDKSQNYNSKVKIIDDFSSLTAFNKLNYLAAYKVCQILGLSDKQIFEGMKSFKLPKGRFDLIYDKEFKIIIDFAHTPNAFLTLLPEIRKKYLKKNGRLIHVFGAAGLRDYKKRPAMGKIAGKYDDLVILTEEDYRTENLYKICEQIENGLLKQNLIKKSYNLINQNDKKVYTIIKDRQKAINFVIKIAKKNDVIVLTGKGHEKSLCRGKIEFPWNEYKAVKIALENKNKKKR